MAGAISLVVVVSAFAALNRAQSTTTLQERSIELSSQGRLALDQIGRDIRSAGDSVQLLPAACLGAAASAAAPFGCPAILEAHPWRVVLARYMWDSGADGIPFTTDDVLTDNFFTDDPQNVVAYEFIPRQQVSGPGGQAGFLGRIDRIVNPFEFNGVAAQRDLILDNVVVDNRMSVSPDGSEVDTRRNHALFMYRLLSIQSGEYQGNAAFTQRGTKVGSFILPPARFYAIPGLGSALPWVKNTPYLPNHTTQIVGLQADGATVPGFRPGKTFAEDMRYILDFNRIRAVLVSFKIAEPREDPDYLNGVDLDPAAPGTARLVQLESTFELKVFSGYLY